MKSRTTSIVAWLIAGVLCAAGIVVLAVGLATPVTFGWFAYQPLAEESFSPVDGGVFVSWTTIVGCVILTIGLLAIAFLTGVNVGRRQPKSVESMR